jgi:hypothetical protein
LCELSMQLDQTVKDKIKYGYKNRRTTLKVKEVGGVSGIDSYMKEHGLGPRGTTKDVRQSFRQIVDHQRSLSEINLDEEIQRKDFTN